MTVYRVIESNYHDDTDLPWEYEEAAFVSWVDEVFLEGYKHIKDSNHCSHCENGEDAPFPTPQEAVDLLEAQGYTVEVV